MGKVRTLSKFYKCQDDNLMFLSFLGVDWEGMTETKLPRARVSSDIPSSKNYVD